MLKKLITCSQRWRAFLALTLLACVSFPALGQTIGAAEISEFLASNSKGIEDEDGDHSDWIEIRNTSGNSGDLDGWFLTDDPTNLTKWRIPATAISAGGYVVIFASSKDRSDPASELHTNFRLSSTAGSYLALVQPNGTTAASEFSSYPFQYSDFSYGFGAGELVPETYLEEGAMATMLVPSGPLPGWNELGFDDSSWTTSTTGLGYDNPGGDYEPFFGNSADALALRTAMRDVNSSAYFRIPFDVPIRAGIQNFVLNARWEDGFVAFLNGVEVHRERAPQTLVWNSSTEPGTSRNEAAAVLLDAFSIDPSALVQGANVLAVQAMSNSAGSSDLLFSPTLTAVRSIGGDDTLGFFPQPTPGDANSLSFEGITEDTKFSVDRGLYDTAFNLIITSNTPGASIRYTTDGSPPNETTGQLYSGPITISETTVVRAIAFMEGFFSTDVDTHTYLFAADIASQPTMATSITQDPIYGPQMVAALTAIPTISLSFDGTDIDREEIPISVELLNFESGNKQVDAGAARFGSFVTNFEKRSFRLHFRSQYGPSQLEFPLFEETDYPIKATSEFDSLDVRAGNHDMIDRGAYLSNRFTDDTMLEMGNLSAHGRFVHIYFNGLYHGQYHLRERWDASMAAQYLPGKEDEFDTLNVNNSAQQFGAPNLQEIQDGDSADWTAMRDLLDNSPTPFSATKDALDVANLIDFMLLWSMGQSETEFRAAGSIENGVGFKFFMKDSDGYLRQPNSWHVVTHNGPLNAMTRFRNEGDPDFRTLLADRIQQHFFNGGALTPEANIARLQHRLDEISVSFIAEAARRSLINSPTRSSANHTPVGLRTYHENIINNRFPALTGERLDRLREANMYPDIIAPVLSQHGGSITPGSDIVMTTDATAIYYTLDGSDPRQEGGAIDPTAINASFDGDFDPNAAMPEDFVVTGSVWKYLDDGTDQGSAWTAATFNDSSWSSGPSQLGYGDGDEVTAIDFIDTDPTSASIQKNATTYFRHEVSIPNPFSYTHFTLNLLYDDAAAVYVNGIEVARTTNLSAGATYNTFAITGTSSETAFERFTIPTSSFTAGDNVLAVEVHNNSATSSDISFDLNLRGEVDANSGANSTVPITLNAPAQFRARSYNTATEEWSALTSTFFSFNSTPATADNLVISEIHYNPAEPTSSSETAVSIDRDDYEFIELLNIGAQPVELSGVNFSDGITFAFGDESLLNPGERAVLVGNIEAFQARYGSEITIAGEYLGKLSNGGERLSLNREGSGILREFIYEDNSPWPTAPDGAGVSLVLRSPETNPDHALAENWGGHTSLGGSPGGVDLISSAFELWKTENGVLSDFEDNDQDGLPALMEYALGTSLSIPDADTLFELDQIEVAGENYLTIRYPRNDEASGVIYQIQLSTDLENWVNEDAIEVEPDIYRIVTPMTNLSRQMLRIKITVN